MFDTFTSGNMACSEISLAAKETDRAPNKIAPLLISIQFLILSTDV
jgi:hypothetical protein